MKNLKIFFRVGDLKRPLYRMSFHGDERLIQNRRAVHAVSGWILRYNLIIVEGKVIHREGGKCRPLFFAHKKLPECDPGV